MQEVCQTIKIQLAEHQVYRALKFKIKLNSAIFKLKFNFKAIKATVNEEPSDRKSNHD